MYIATHVEYTYIYTLRTSTHICSWTDKVMDLGQSGATQADVITSASTCQTGADSHGH